MLTAYLPRTARARTFVRLSELLVAPQKRTGPAYQ